MASRKIFTTNGLTERLVNGMTKEYDMSINDLVNDALKEYFLPYNEALRKETNYLYKKLESAEEIDEKELQACLVRVVESLKNNPVKDVEPMEQVLLHFIFNAPMRHRYDYIQIVDSLQDERLHRLNEILKTVDRDYTLGTREFGERCRYIFQYWNQLYQYSEIYVELATIIQCETIYRHDLDVYRTLCLIRWLDRSIYKDNIEPIRDPYPTNISLKDKYYGLRYEIITYHTDNGYAELSKDVEFKEMSDEIRQYYKDLDKNRLRYEDEITQKDYEELQALEAEGRRLFRRLGGRPRRVN